MPCLKGVKKMSTVVDIATKGYILSFLSTLPSLLKTHQINNIMVYLLSTYMSVGESVLYCGKCIILYKIALIDFMPWMHGVHIAYLCQKYMY